MQVEACAAVPRVAARRASRSRSTPALTIADGIAVKRPGDLTLRAHRALGRRRRPRRGGGRGRRGDGAAARARQARRRGRGRGRRRRAAGGRVAPAPRRHDRRRSSPAATSTPGCSRRSPAATRPRRAGGCVLFTRVRIAPGRWPRCSRSSGSRARTSSRSSTCARVSTSTSARRRSSSCSRRAAATTRSACCRRSRRPARTRGSCVSSGWRPAPPAVATGSTFPAQTWTTSTASSTRTARAQAQARGRRARPGPRCGRSVR